MSDMATSVQKQTNRAEDDIRIMCVGLTIVDMITVIEKYPEEDSDQRGLGFRKQRGGNASNNCTVLSHLGTPCEYLGVLPPSSDPEHRWLKDDFERHGIKTQGCVSSDRPCPVSTVVVSRHTGSRTIIFCDNGQPVLTHQQFLRAVEDRLAHFTWIHFEHMTSSVVHQFEVGFAPPYKGLVLLQLLKDELCPNIKDYLHMLEYIAEHQKGMAEVALAQHSGKTQNTTKLSVSVEIEKPDFINPECVMLLADVIFISKDWACSQGWTDMCSAVKFASQLCRPDCIVVCPWAEKGAAAWCNGEVLTVAANPPGQVVDTLGAGDTFVAGFLHARARHMPVSYALDFACSLAAAKCTMDGFEGLQHFAKINICA